MKRYAIMVTSVAVLGGAFLWACQDARPNEGLSRVREAWNSPNAPERLQWDFVRDFYALPSEAKLDIRPWMDTYWPTQKGGLNYRWAGSGQGFGLASPSPERVRRMSQSELRALSPAEKYDIFVGRYDYPTVRLERKRTRPDAMSWEGLCHGWAPASINFAEPDAVTLEGANGVKIPFGSSDVKALLTYLQGEVSNPRPVNRMLGLRCGIRSGAFADIGNAQACKDVNAGAFHVVLANYVGLRKKGFIADVTRGYEVWNHPVWKYTVKVLGEQNPTRGAAENAVKELLIETKMTYAVETGPTWEPFYKANKRADSTKTFRYRLELDANDEIVGGAWTSADRPDFLWIEDRPEFTGYYSALGRIYQASTGNRDPLNLPPGTTVTPDPTPTGEPTPVATLPLPTGFPTAAPTLPSDPIIDPTFPGDDDPPPR